MPDDRPHHDGPLPDASGAVRLLVIDDDDHARLLLKRLTAGVPEIEVCGEAASGESGLLALRRTRPDVVVIDWQMPGADGIEVVGRLRSRNARLHIIGWTTSSDQAVARAFHAAGAAAVFSKHQASALVTYLRSLAAR